jgi:hypothetical protein
MSNWNNLSKKKNQSPKKYDPVEMNNFLQKLFHSISPLMPINTDLPENYINYYRRILSSSFSIFQKDESKILNMLFDKASEINHGNMDYITRLQTLYSLLTKKKIPSNRWSILYLLLRLSKPRNQQNNFSGNNELLNTILKMNSNQDDIEMINNLNFNKDSNNNINNQNNVLKNNYIQNDKNLFHKYQSNINLFKKRNSNISNITDKQSEILQLSPNKIKNHIFTNDSYEHDTKSRNKIKRLTTRLKIQLNKNEEDNIKQENTLPILKKKKKKELGKIKEEKKEDNKEKPKKLNLKINLKNNSPINNNNEINENQVNEMEENNYHNFLRQKTSFMRIPKNINILEEEKEKFIILDKLKKKTNLKNKRVSISLDKKLTEKSNETSKIETENMHLKNDIESLKNEIEKLKNQNNTLKTEFDNLKNKTEEIQNFEKKLVSNKKTSNLKKGSSSTSLTKKISFNNTEALNEKKGKEDKKNLNDDSKNHSDKKKSKNSIIDLSSKLLEESFSDFKNIENRKSIKNLSYKEEEKKKLLKRNSVQIDLNQKRFANIDYSLNEKKYENNNSNNTDNVYDNLNEYEKDKKKKRRINKYDFII